MAQNQSPLVDSRDVRFVLYELFSFHVSTLNTLWYITVWIADYHNLW